MYRLIMTLGLIAAVGAGWGCGGSDGEATSEPLTKAEFIKQANALCLKINREELADAAAWKKSYPGGVAEAEAHADDALRTVIVPYMRRKAEELGALEPPAEDRAKIDRMVRNLSRASETLDDEGLEALTQSGALEFRQEATAYGLKSCGDRL
jgi:hypothetical protein